MKLVLKDFNTLSKQLDDTITVILKIEKKVDISKLDPRRSAELRFLTATRDALKKRIDEEKPKSTVAQAEVLTAAMFLIIRDISNHTASYESYGKLHKALSDIVGSSLDADDQIRLSSALNHFLNGVYETNDSRKGYKADNFLAGQLSPTEISKLMKLSYKIEKEGCFAQSAALVGGADSALGNHACHSLAGLSVKTPDFATVQESYRELRRDELAAKKVTTVQELGTRSPQYLFLDQLNNELSNSKLNDKQKAGIFMGAMYIIRSAIAIEYKQNPAAKQAIAKSLTHKHLTSILKTQETPFADIEMLTRAARDYVGYLTVTPATSIENADKTRSFTVATIRKNHPFKAIEATMGVAAVQGFAHLLIEDCQVQVVDELITPSKQASASTGFASLAINLPFSGAIFSGSAAAASSASTAAPAPEPATETPANK